LVYMTWRSAASTNCRKRPSTIR